MQIRLQQGAAAVRLVRDRRLRKLLINIDLSKPTARFARKVRQPRCSVDKLAPHDGRRIGGRVYRFGAAQHAQALSG